MDVEMRQCIGSSRFGIEAHDAPVSEFPRQPSQKDGLGRMCKPHWSAYTTALRRAADARKAAAAAAEPEAVALTAEADATAASAKPAATTKARGRKAATPTEPAPKRGRSVVGASASPATVQAIPKTDPVQEGAAE